MASSTGYWTFFCNPRVWDPRHARPRKYEEYNVHPWHKGLVVPGQKGVIRVGYDKRTRAELKGRTKLARGIYAVVEVATKPKLVVSSLTKEYDDPKRRGREHYYCRLKYLAQMYDNPIPLETIPRSAYDRYLVEGFRASTMPLSSKTYHWVWDRVQSR